MEVLEVHNPTGRVEVLEGPSPRISDLHGKTICMLWNGLFRGDKTFPYLQQLVIDQFPDARVVPYNELPIGYHDVKTIGEMVKLKGCDVVIGGNGG